VIVGIGLDSFLQYELFEYEKEALSNGLTVIVKFLDEPVQAPDLGVTVITELIGLLPVFVPTNEFILPVPLDAKPIAVLFEDQSKVVPAVPVKLIALEVFPEQIV
jgi:hypothetical protein